LFRFDAKFTQICRGLTTNISGGVEGEEHHKHILCDITVSFLLSYSWLWSLFNAFNRITSFATVDSFSSPTADCHRESLERERERESLRSTFENDAHTLPPSSYPRKSVVNILENVFDKNSLAPWLQYETTSKLEWQALHQPTEWYLPGVTQ
jgi:hypothetical protein